MKEQEALEILNSECEDISKVQRALKVANEALEKQVAKKPRFYAHNYYCAECGNLVGNNEFQWQRFLYCDKCGQKLDWSDEE